MARMVKCAKLGVEAEGLDRPPYPGALGKRIFDEISKESWQRWLAHQTMIINENRLNPMDPAARELLRSEMEKYLFGSGSDLPKGYVTPEGE